MITQTELEQAVAAVVAAVEHAVARGGELSPEQMAAVAAIHAPEDVGGVLRVVRRTLLANADHYLTRAELLLRLPPVPKN